MKVKQLYNICKQLIGDGHAEYDVTIEMEGDRNQRELITESYTKQFKDDNIGLFVLKTDRPLGW